MRNKKIEGGRVENVQHDEKIDEVDGVDNTEFAGTESGTPPTPAEAKAVAVTEAAEKRAPMTLDEMGMLKAKDSNEEWRIADLMLKSKAIPQVFQNVPQVIMAVQFIKAHGLVPAIAIRQTTIINGTLSIWGELPKALCIRSGELEEFEEVLFDREYNIICFDNKNLHLEVFGAKCSLKRKGRPAVTRTFTMDEAKTAGVLSKNNSVWKFYPRRMIQMRARSIALKDEFPDVLSGVAIAEYDFDRLGPGEDTWENREVKTPAPTSIADEINAEVSFDQAKPGEGQEVPQHLS
jgi:hypothetical protein